MLKPWIEEIFGTLLFQTLDRGWMKAGGGSKVILRWFRWWRWCPGGQPRGQTAPAARKWHRRGSVQRTWSPQWSYRPPGRLPALPPDGPDAQRGRDTWRGESKEGEDTTGGGGDEKTGRKSLEWSPNLQQWTEEIKDEVREEQRRAGRNSLHQPCLGHNVLLN